MHDATHSSAPSKRPSERALRLERMSLAELERIFVDGATPDADDLVGWEFRGINSPAWARLAGIKKFIKGFHRRDGGVYGYNCPVVQNKLADEWIARPDDDNPKRFGFYSVTPVDPTARDNTYLHALLLDYGKGGNPRTDPSRGLRDYLVQPFRDEPNILLGKAYFALGPLRVPTFSFFILERHRRGLTDVAYR